MNRNIAIMIIMGCAACGGSNVSSNGPNFTRQNVNCTAGDEAMAVYNASQDDVLETVHAFAHDTQFRQEQVRQVPITVQEVATGTQATAACSGASFIEFAREIWP